MYVFVLIFPKYELLFQRLDMWNNYSSINVKADREIPSSTHNYCFNTEDTLFSVCYQHTALWGYLVFHQNLYNYVLENKFSWKEALSFVASNQPDCVVVSPSTGNRSLLANHIHPRSTNAPGAIPSDPGPPSWSATRKLKLVSCQPVPSRWRCLRPDRGCTEVTLITTSLPCQAPRGMHADSRRARR